MFDLLIKNGIQKNLIQLPNSIYAVLESHAKKHPEKEAVITIDVDKTQEKILSYESLLILINKTANFLFQKGIKKNNRIAFIMHNTSDILALEIAASLIGASSVPLDIKRDDAERISFKLNDADAKLIFIQTEKENLKKEFELIKMNFSSKEFIFLDEHISLEKLTENYSAQLIFSVQEDLTGEYIILYTSGSTSKPKGVPLTIKSCLANANGIINWQKLSSSDKFNIVLPLHHVNSTIFCLSILLSGGTIILNSRYSVSKFWEIVSKYKSSLTSVVPTILHDLVSTKEEFISKKYDISSLKRILIGSAPVLPEETLRFYDEFKVKVIQGYGQTETSLRVTGVPIDLDEEMYRNIVKINSIGIELDYCNVTILNNDCEDVKENEEGEICIRGPVLGNGYLNNVEETTKSFVNGWFHSGDLGYYKLICGKKYFFIKGRIKEIIIKGGVNISPAAIEDKLISNFPEINEVCVIGYPDIRMGEVVAAVINLKNNYLSEMKKELINGIIKKCKCGKIGIPQYEIPEKIFLFDQALPKTSTGKIKRVEVKKIVSVWKDD